MKTIVINADDFGRILERNDAIDNAVKCGLIGSITLMVNSLYTQDAVNKAIKGGMLIVSIVTSILQVVR